MNTDDLKMKQRATRDFIEKICGYVRSGYGFIPFVGSGISASSGILMGKDFTEYLAYTTYRVLVSEQGAEENPSKRWSLRRNGWPKYPTPDEVATARTWIKKQFADICKRVGLHAKFEGDTLVGLRENTECQPAIHQQSNGTNHSFRILDPKQIRRPLIPSILGGNSASLWGADQRLKEMLTLLDASNTLLNPVGSFGASPTSEDSIIELGIRSLHDWPATLEFLAQVDVKKFDDSRNHEYIYLAERDKSVIDSFNTHITSGKKGNLGHKMLGHLVRPLRTRTILTTNFDPLLEESFEELNEQFKVLPVSAKGALPHPSTVLAQNCIIKLHGDMLETRADFTINEPPSVEDKKRFAAYFRQSGRTAKSHHISNMLLVIGYSASDQRCVQFIKYALDTLRNFQVFWICYDKTDVQKVEGLFDEDSYKERFFSVQTDRPDLLLYELYQQLELSLPGGGFAYEFTHKVPPERASNQLTNSAIVDTCVTAISSILLESQTDAEKPFCDHAVVEKLKISEGGKERTANSCWVVDIQSGAAQVMRRVFRRLQENRKNCVWFELSDYTDPHALAYEILRVISLRLGLYQLEHINFLPADLNETAGCEQSLRRTINYFGIQAENWFVFLYGRDAPGSTSGWQNDVWGTEKYRQLTSLLSYLDKVGFRVLYLPLTKRREKRNIDKSKIIEKFASHQPLYSNLAPVADENPTPVVDSENTLKDAQADNRFSDSVADLKSIRGQLFGQIIYSVLHWLCDSEWEIKESDNSFDNNLHRDEIFEGFLKALGEKSVNDQKLLFLYSIVLFRQSRHMSAVLSEAVYPCPNRFNANGCDNDKERFDKVQTWIQELCDRYVFYLKPGGYLWIHQDVRIALQSILGSLPNIVLKDDRNWIQKLCDAYVLNQKPGGYLLNHQDVRNDLQEILASLRKIVSSIDHKLLNIPHRKLDFGQQIRARTHYWIGDWYRKAFYATGHHIPLIESLYHLSQCIRFCPDAKPPYLEIDQELVAIVHHRIHLAELALAEMIKTFWTARPWLKFWLQSPADNPMFSEGAEWSRIVDELAAQRNTLGITKNIEERTKPLIDLLYSELETLDRSCKGEAGVFAGKRLFLYDFPSEAENSAALDLWRREKELTFNTDRIASNNWRQQFEEVFEKLKFQSVIKRLEEYERSHHLDSGPLRELVKKDKTEWVFSDSNDSTHLFLLIQALSEFAYLHVKRAKLETHAETPLDWAELAGSLKNDIDYDRLRKLWVQVCALCYLALDLCKNLHPAFLQIENSQRIKCHTLYGLALGHLGRFFEAHRRLGEANAILSKSGESPEELNGAIIQLRRAEVYLTESRFIRSILDSENSPESRRRTYCLFPDISTVQNRWSGKQIRELYRLHVAALDDAWVALEGAERKLSGKSHSSLWWGRLYALKLRVYGERYPLKEKGTAIPAMLAFRRRIQYDDYIEKLFDKGMLVSAADNYRQLRMTDYFIRATFGVKRRHPSPAQLEIIAKMLSELRGISKTKYAPLHKYKSKLLNSVRKLLKRQGGTEKS